jgi:hypothetical protein
MIPTLNSLHPQLRHRHAELAETVIEFSVSAVKTWMIADEPQAELAETMIAEIGNCHCDNQVNSGSS